jgi:hypothetical protein
MNAKGCDANIDTIYDRYDSASKGLVTYCDYAVDLGPVTCEQQIVGSGSIIDVSPDPAPSQPWFYLLRDHVTPGNCGLDSSGRERVPASGDCP